jgi:hypothetical protein
VFKKKEGEVKPEKSKLKKTMQGIAYVVLGLFALAIFSGGDGGSGYSYSEDGSDAQKFMIALADETKSSFSSSDTDAKKKMAWIGASKKLCNSSVFNAAGLQQDWLGKVKEIEANDSMTLTTYLRVDGSGTKIFNTSTKAELEKLGLFTTMLNLKENDMVRFSGQFRLGDMSGDNECIERVSFDDGPEFSGQTLRFDFARVTKLEPKDS